MQKELRLPVGESGDASYAWLLLCYLLGYVSGTIYTTVFVLQKAQPTTISFGDGIAVTMIRWFFPLALILLFAIHPVGVFLIPAVFVASGICYGSLISVMMKHAQAEALYEAILVTGPELLYYFLVITVIGSACYGNSVRIMHREAGITLRNLSLLIRVTPAVYVLKVMLAIALMIAHRVWVIPFLLT